MAKRFTEADVEKLKAPRQKRPRDLFGNLIPEAKERDVQGNILKYLRVRGIFHWRANSGAVKTERGHFLRINFPGCPDVLAIKPPHGTLVGIECKRKSTDTSPVQEMAREGFEKNGAIYIVARSVEDVQQVMEAV